MTLGELVDLAMQRVAEGRVTGDFSYTRIEFRAYIAMQLAEAIPVAMFQETRRNENTTGRAEVPAPFLSTYEDIEIKHSEKRGRYYIDLPAAPMRLPNSAGIDLVCFMGDEENAWKLVGQNFESMFRTNPAGFMEGHIAFWQEGPQTLYIAKNPATETDNPDILSGTGPSNPYERKVMARLVVDATSAPESMTLGIDQSVASFVLDKTVQFFMTGNAPDASTDGVQNK